MYHRVNFKPISHSFSFLSLDSFKQKVKRTKVGHLSFVFIWPQALQLWSLIRYKNKVKTAIHVFGIDIQTAMKLKWKGPPCGSVLLNFILVYRTRDYLGSYFVNYMDKQTNYFGPKTTKKWRKKWFHWQIGSLYMEPRETD